MSQKNTGGVVAKTYLYRGKYLTCRELADKFEIKLATMSWRLRKFNGDTEKATVATLIKTPIKTDRNYRRSSSKLYVYRGKEWMLSELAKETGINSETLRGRLLKFGADNVEKACQHEKIKQKQKQDLIIKTKSADNFEEVDYSELEEVPRISSKLLTVRSKEAQERINNAYEKQVYKEVCGEDLW